MGWPSSTRFRRKPSQGLIVYSDRGVQYTSTSFREKLIAAGARQGMGRKGNCYDNACCESFFHTLKTKEVYFNRYHTRAEARSSIFEYIEGRYNIKRRHSTLGYKAPSQFELLKRAS
jgi:putative transposase